MLDTCLSHVAEVPSPGRRVGAVSPARLVTRKSAQAEGHVKAAAKRHPERSGGRGLDGEPTGARVRVSRSGGCTGYVLDTGSYDYTREARCRGRQKCGQCLRIDTFTIGHNQ